MGVSETAKPLVRAQLLAAVNKPHGVSRRYSSKSMKGICSPVDCFMNEPPGRGLVDGEKYFLPSTIHWLTGGRVKIQFSTIMRSGHVDNSHQNSVSELRLSFEFLG